MNDYWGLVAESYPIAFQDGSKTGLKDRYFEGPNAYDARAKTTFVLPHSLKLKKRMLKVRTRLILRKIRYF